MQTRKDFDPSAPIARHEMALGLTSLFRALPDGAKRQEVVLEQKFAGWSIRVMGPELSAFEQGIFFSLLQIAGRGNGEQVPAQDAGLLPNIRQKKNGEINSAAGATALRINCKIPDLLACAGYSSAHETGGGSRTALEKALQRLGSVTIAATDANGRGGLSHLIAARWRGSDLEISLNPRSAAALIALRSYASINMRTYLKLSTPTAKILYSWVCAWFCGAGGERLIGLDKLEMHVFGDCARARSTRGKRRGAIRDAARQISDAGSFEMQIDGRGMIKCRRVSAEGAPSGGHCRPAVDILPPSGGHAHSENGPV